MVFGIPFGKYLNSPAGISAGLKVPEQTARTRVVACPASPWSEPQLFCTQASMEAKAAGFWHKLATTRRQMANVVVTPPLQAS